MKVHKQTLSYITPEEYLEYERSCEYKHEYFNGEIFAMSGASRKHNLIIWNISASLHRQLRNRTCEVYMNDMRVKVSETGLYTYPDIAVVCDKPQFEDQLFDTLLNPAVIFEVLSESTENYDRGKKFLNYRTITCLSDYILVSQDSYHIEHFIRQSGNRWLFLEYNHLKDKIAIESMNCEIRVEEVYEKIEIQD